MLKIGLAFILQDTDFEDAVTHAIAKNQGEAIVTRNIKDFRLRTISAMLPEVFLATFI